MLRRFRHRPLTHLRSRLLTVASESTTEGFTKQHRCGGQRAQSVLVFGGSLRPPHLHTRVCDSPRGGRAHDSTHDPRGRIARRIFPDGDDPDPRFTLANERTFLSWIRTALAFIGGGIAVEAFTSEIFSTGLRATLSIVLMVIGFVLASGAAFRWHR